MSTTISTTIDVDATPQAVWEVLTDFAAYDEWNPFMRIEGTSEVGARLVVHMTPEGSRGMTFKPKVVAATAGQELRWLGRLGFGGVFDGEHSFVLTPHADGSTRLAHGEHFSGILVSLLGGTVKKAEAGFDAFNQALKERVEAAGTPR